jgi:subtilase family serine protease
MAITTNIYEENTLRQLATYGFAHQGYSTIWKLKSASIFAVLCTTDSALYSSSFVGTVEQLLATGVTELSSQGGHIYTLDGTTYSVPFALRDVSLTGLTSITGVTFPGRDNYVAAVGTTGYKFIPQITWAYFGATQPMKKEIGWGFTSAVSFKSALLCIQLPVKTPGATFYQRSYPLAMIDFGATIARAASSSFFITWDEDGMINWTR